MNGDGDDNDEHDEDVADNEKLCKLVIKSEYSRL